MFLTIDLWSFEGNIIFNIFTDFFLRSGPPILHVQRAAVLFMLPRILHFLARKNFIMDQ